MARVFDVRRLRVLQEVARRGSLSGAATALNYTTSAVSQQITALERDVGASLLARGPWGARPTPAGTRLLEHAERIIADGRIDAFKAQRYAGWDGALGQMIHRDGTSLSDIADHAISANLDPRHKSGKQERLENLINRCRRS